MHPTFWTSPIWDGYAPGGTGRAGGIYSVTAMSFCLRKCIGFLWRVTALEPCRTICVRGSRPGGRKTVKTPAKPYHICVCYTSQPIKILLIGQPPGYSIKLVKMVFKTAGNIQHIWQVQKYCSCSTLPGLGSNFTHKVAAMSNRKLAQAVTTCCVYPNQEKEVRHLKPFSYRGVCFEKLKYYLEGTQKDTVTV